MSAQHRRKLTATITAVGPYDGDSSFVDATLTISGVDVGEATLTTRAGRDSISAPASVQQVLAANGYSAGDAVRVIQAARATLASPASLD